MRKKLIYKSDRILPIILVSILVVVVVCGLFGFYLAKVHKAEQKRLQNQVNNLQNQARQLIDEKQQYDANQQMINNDGIN